MSNLTIFEENVCHGIMGCGVIDHDFGEDGPEIREAQEMFLRFAVKGTMAENLAYDWLKVRSFTNKALPLAIDGLYKQMPGLKRDGVFEEATEFIRRRLVNYRVPGGNH